LNKTAKTVVKAAPSSVYMINSDKRPFSNRCPLIKGILKLASLPNSQIYGRFIGYG
jgi:hypothetical protein